MQQAVGDIAKDYHRGGYYFPIPVMSEQAAGALTRSYQSLEREFVTDDETKHLLTQHGLFMVPFLYHVVCCPQMLEPVKAILGEDLLIWSAELLIKEANTPDFVSWHQDLTYWDLSGEAEVTAWLALTQATVENGCMRFVPGSHAGTIVPHHDTFVEANMLSRGQCIKEVNETEAVNVTLRPGEMSLHHGHMFHASQANRSNHRRVGFVMRFIAPSMYQRSGARPSAFLVSGQDTGGHFRLASPPTRLCDAVDVARAREHMRVQDEFLYQRATAQGKRLD